MKTGAELIKQLEQDITEREKIEDERFARILNHDTDIDDCFVSINATSEAIALAKAKIKILKNGGVAIFDKLATLDGIVLNNSRIINSTFGECWVAEGKYISIPSYGCKAGKSVWVEAGFKNHSHASKQLMKEINTKEYLEKNKLYHELGAKAKALGYAEKGYKVVQLERPAWVTMRSSNCGLHSYPFIFESNINYFTGE